MPEAVLANVEVHSAMAGALAAEDSKASSSRGRGRQEAVGALGPPWPSLTSAA